MSNLYVSLEEVKRIVEHWHDLLSYTWNTRDYMETLYKKVESMPTIDPISEIDKLIEENLYKIRIYRDRDDSTWAIDYRAMASEAWWAYNTLQELRQRLLTKN